MNKAILKTIRRIASQLPPCTVEEKVPGHILILEGIHEVEGERVVPNMYYMTNRVVNHYRQMKGIYKQFGLQATKDYIANVVGLNGDAMKSQMAVDMAMLERQKIAQI